MQSAGSEPWKRSLVSIQSGWAVLENGLMLEADISSKFQLRARNLADDCCAIAFNET